jgi:hypothetical protein
VILLGIAEASRFWWLRRRAACGKYGKYGKFSASFCGRRTNSEKDCYGNYTASRAQPVKTFRTFRTFRSATAQSAASCAPDRALAEAQASSCARQPRSSRDQQANQVTRPRAADWQGHWGLFARCQRVPRTARARIARIFCPDKNHINQTFENGKMTEKKSKRGGARPGAGRPKGSTERRFLEQPEQRKRYKNATTPIEYLLAVMNDPLADFRRRDRAARAAVKYCHPKATASKPK